jgi:thiamine-phosphate pyrophosphorylase
MPALAGPGRVTRQDGIYASGFLKHALARTLLSIARHNRACLTLHGDAALAKACGADGVHLPAGGDPIESRAMLGPAKLIGVSLHTVTEAEVINPSVVDYAIAGPTFETRSKPGYGPEIGRKGVARIARAAPLPVLAIGGLNATRAAEVLAAGPVGIAVMGGVMRAADPGQVVRALACHHCRSSSLAVGNLPEAVATP